MDFAALLTELILQKKPIIYMDESSLHFHLRNPKTWTTAAFPVIKELGSRRFSGVTVFGAIGESIGGGLFMTAKSTNTDDCLKFVRLLIDRLRPREIRPYIVLDNHSAHKTKVVKDLLDSHFNVLYLPVASSEFNSIERAWAVGKRTFK